MCRLLQSPRCFWFFSLFLSLSIFLLVFFAACMHVAGSTVNATPLSDLPASLQASPVVGSLSDVASTSSLSDTPINKTNKKNRCFMCRKKVGLTGECMNVFFCVGSACDIACICVVVEIHHLVWWFWKGNSLRFTQDDWGFCLILSGEHILLAISLLSPLKDEIDYELHVFVFLWSVHIYCLPLMAWPRPRLHPKRLMFSLCTLFSWSEWTGRIQVGGMFCVVKLIQSAVWVDYAVPPLAVWLTYRV